MNNKDRNILIGIGLCFLGIGTGIGFILGVVAATVPF